MTITAAPILQNRWDQIAHRDLLASYIVILAMRAAGVRTDELLSYEDPSHYAQQHMWGLVESNRVALENGWVIVQW